MRKNIIKNIIGCLALSFSATSCFDMEEVPFTMLSPDNYFVDEASINQVIANIYAQEQGDLSEFYWYAQELTADQIAWRSWNGGSWGWDSADKFVLSTHTWTPMSNYVNRIWGGAWTAIGLCNNFIADITELGPEKVQITQEQFDAYIAEVRTFRAYCFYNIFEVFGGVIPISVSADTDVLPTSACAGVTFEEGCKKVCTWMLTELDESNSLLPVNGPANRCSQAMNRMIKMRILLNSEIFTGEPRFSEAKQLAKDIIDGKYGSYTLAKSYQEIFSANNDTECKEIIFAFSSDRTYNTKSTNMRNGPFMNYTFAQYFDCVTVHSGWNCCALTPSFDNSSNFYDQCIETVVQGEEKKYNVVAEMYDKEKAKCFLDPPYNDKLGAIHERYDPRDLRLVKPYCNGTSATDWGGIFMEGVIRDNYGKGEVQLADADRKNMPLVYVDQIGNFQGKGNNPLQVVENPRWGETNSGLRAAKYPYYTQASGFDMAAADVVEFRLTEAYYTYAECLLREGNSSEAKKWVNYVRERYFSAEDWKNGKTLPDGRVLVGAEDQAPRGFSSEFDADRMLSEWGIEFFDEGHRRRTDLRRFDKFTQGQWWFFGRATETGYDLPAKRDRKYEWFPLPDKALTANPGLVQNPYYK